jgi:hypothetical protein
MSPAPSANRVSARLSRSWSQVNAGQSGSCQFQVMIDNVDGFYVFIDQFLL